MLTKRFQKRTEDFTCAVCGEFVEGTGFTNHCPKCLWSRHVDINPGDRASPCGGLMEPVSLDKKAGRFVILHRCQRCGFKRRQKLPGEFSPLSCNIFLLRC